MWVYNSAACSGDKLLCGSLLLQSVPSSVVVCSEEKPLGEDPLPVVPLSAAVCSEEKPLGEAILPLSVSLSAVIL